MLPSLPPATVFVSVELLRGGAASAPLSSEPEADGLLNTVLNKDNLSIDKLNILTIMSYVLNVFILSPTSGVNTQVKGPGKWRCV